MNLDTTNINMACFEILRQCTGVAILNILTLLEWCDFSKTNLRCSSMAIYMKELEIKPMYVRYECIQQRTKRTCKPSCPNGHVVCILVSVLHPIRHNLVLGGELEPAFGHFRFASILTGACSCQKVCALEIVTREH